MEPPPKPSTTSLFQVYLRLRPPPSPLVQLTQQSLYPLLPPPERYLTVEPLPLTSDGLSTHITIHPPSDSRKRAVEKFAFTKVFEEDATQLQIFKGTGILPLVEGVLEEGRDGLLATLGVTGSGKSHTTLGSKSQRGQTQLSLDLLYRSLSTQALDPSTHPSLIASLCATDPSEAQILSAAEFSDSMYGDGSETRNGSRAATPMVVGCISISELSGRRAKYPETVPFTEHKILPSWLPFWNTPRKTRAQAKLHFGPKTQDPTFVPSTPKRSVLQRPPAHPQFPDISDLAVMIKPDAEYAILVSMYEVYNDRIYDLLSHPRSLKDHRRRPLLFKPTELSPDRKLVAGLRKVVCGNYDEALMVLETGLMERRVAGTGSNSVSSRSHGFFCIEARQRSKMPKGALSTFWSGSQLTIVDLAGSERARNAKTAGATLAEAGKINESLMYLGQCLQMQSDCHDGAKPCLVPFRQCKLTELLFSNSFPSTAHNQVTHPTQSHRNAQKAIMIVTADPVGDFNATSQILRYSALAREVTVPRIPSVTSTILHGAAANAGSQKMQSGPTSPSLDVHDDAMMEIAFSEIARLTEEVEVLEVKLAEQEGRRKEAEQGWQRADEKAEEIERQVREECWTEMEKRSGEDRRRWINAWGEEADRNDEHLDRKLEILSQGFHSHTFPLCPRLHLLADFDPVHDDPPPSTASRIEALESENEELRRKLKNFERDLQSQSPTRSAFKKPPNTPPSSTVLDDCGTTLFKLNALSLIQEKRVGGGASPLMTTPGRKTKKMTARQWDLGDENDLDAFGEY